MSLLLRVWHQLRYSLWLIPALIVAGAILLAILTIVLDGRIDSDELPDWPRLFTGSADGARGTLEVIASAMISIAALTFSITVLVLSSAAATYTPRVIRTFMGSTLTKTVLGVFVGVYAYALIILRTVSSSEPEFVPAIGVTLGLLLALVGVGFLIAFIHHMAYAIQVSTIVSKLGHDTVEAARELFPECTDDEDAAHDGEQATHCEPAENEEWFIIPARKTGYVQIIDTAELARRAAEADLVLRMECLVGEFVMERAPLARTNRRPDDRLITCVNQCHVIGVHRTVEQDVGVGLRQLTDIALRAMSPAVNDSTTASMCIDYSATILAELAQRKLLSGTQGWNGQRSLILRCHDFSAYLRLGFEQIRQQAGSDLAVYLRLLGAFATIAPMATQTTRRQAIEREARLVMEYGRKNLSNPDEQIRLEAAWQALGPALQEQA